ncbi:MAG: RNA polymerase sigma factor [Bacteroidota bacterium]
MDDKQLVSKFLKTRSEKAFSNLYRAKTPRLYQMALRLTANNQYKAEELVQEMWCIAVRKLESFEWRSELKTWLTGILINLSREDRKRKEKEHLLREELLEADLEQPSPANITTLDLEKALIALPAGYRQVIILHDIEGYKHKEIAEMMDISEGTSKSQLFHARKTLRNYLKEGNENNTTS